MSPRRALVVVNRSSRRGADAGDVVADTLRDAGFDVVHADCVKARDLSDLIRAHAGDVDLVVLGGGDGTLNAALPGLLATGLPLGIVPLGTANDLARTLGIAADAAVASAVIADGHRRRLDVGEVNGHPFFNVASVGFGVDLTRALTHDAKKRWGVLGYAVAGFRTLRRMSRFTVRIEQDGRVIHRGRTVHLAIGNGRHYGGGMTVSESAAIDDGRLNVYSLEVRSRWRLLFLLPSMRRGDHGRWEEVVTLSSAALTVRTRRARSVNADGEIVTKTPAEFRVLPGAIEVFVPAEAGPDRADGSSPTWLGGLVSQQ